MKRTIVTFGEIMTRISAPGHLRLRQCLPGTLNAAFAGAESNIAASIALLGGKSRFVTALPQNVLADSCIDFLRGFGVDTSQILQRPIGRMPQYFIETGVSQRPGQVLYDRENSTFSLTDGVTYPWDAILKDASWLVLSGISPALSAKAAEATLQAAREAQSRNVTVCCDLNFRSKLWNWEPGTPPRELARRIMGQLMPYIDVVITNPEQAFDVLNIPWRGAASENIAAYGDAARRIAQAHPHLKLVVFTMRESISASHNKLGALLYDCTSDHVYVAPLSVNGETYQPYKMHQIVDRLGAGDAFAAALIYALHTPKLNDYSNALAFAVAAACLAHSIPGDINFVTRSEIETLMEGDGSGRVIR